MLKYKVVLLFAFVAISQIVFAQQDLEVQGTTPSLYLVHTIVAKDNWFSVGRLYNQAPNVLATYNATTLKKPLIIGQTLKIPLNNTNFSQNGVCAKDEVMVPIYHAVQEKEWMYRISVNHNKVPVATLEKWNNIKNGQVKVGMEVVIGFLKIRTNQSALAAKGSKKIVPATPSYLVKNEAPADEKTNEVKKDDVAIHDDIKKDEASAVVKETNDKAVVKEEPKPQPQNDDKIVQKEEPKVQKEEEKNIHPIVETGITSSNTTIASVKGGYFKILYAASGKDAMGNAGVFKSTSGWKDGKYYALMNGVPVGTIVKVTFSSTNKTVFAKVLGQMPEMKESTGLMMRISDAAATELGAENGKFYVDVKY